MRHNDYPATLLMEPATNDEPARYRLTPAASTVRGCRVPRDDRKTARAYQVACIEFERGDHAPSMQWVGVDVAGGPGTAAVVTYTRTGSTVRIDTVFSAPAFPNVVSTGLPTWLASTESASGAALIGAKTEPEAEARIGRRVVAINGDRGYFAAGDAGVVIDVDYDGDLMVRFDPSPTSEPGPFWYVCPKNVRFIEADTPAPAAQESAKPIAAYRFDATMWRIGLMFYRCDADGWIPHTPTADAVCPVPDGVEIELMTRQSTTYLHAARVRASDAKWQSPSSIVAWRPTQA